MFKASDALKLSSKQTKQQEEYIYKRSFQNYFGFENLWRMGFDTPLTPQVLRPYNLTKIDSFKKN